jgi:integrase/recombinase XerD
MAGEKGISRIQDINKKDLADYHNRIFTAKRIRDGHALSSSMKNSKLIALKNFFKFSIKTGQILYNPASDIEGAKDNRYHRLKDVLNEKEVLKVIKAADARNPISRRDRAILELLYSTGIRNTELRELELRDVDLERQEARIRHGKGYFGPKERLLPMGRFATAYMEEYLINTRPKLVKDHSNQFIFLGRLGNKLGIDVPNDIVKRYARLACVKKYVSTHIFRHTCATHLLRNGANIRYVQEMLGHSSLDSTRAYTRIEITDLKKIHHRCHPREKDA